MKILATLIIVLSLGNFSPEWQADPALEFGDPAFASVWNRVDKPVRDLPGAGRGYTWGPALPQARPTTTEPYDDSPRKVQYFDKARMEINRAATRPAADLYYVTTGLLVKELVTGNRQDGDNRFTRLAPSQVQVAGDSNEGGANQLAPTYASFQSLGTFAATENGRAFAPNELINRQVRRDGSLLTITPPEQRTIKDYDPVTQHNIADVFADFGKQTGPLWTGQEYQPGPVFFGSPLYVLGRPLTEPYWTEAIVAQVKRNVLVQLFERRVLTYTPANPDGFKVEMGNVGQHYYRWRYTTNPTMTITTTFVGSPLTAGDFIFWVDNRAGENTRALYGYDLTRRAEFLISDAPGDKLSVVSDGRTVAWVETPRVFTNSETRVQGYDLARRLEFNILPAEKQRNYNWLAVDNSLLYYQESGPEHSGLFARDLATGQEERLSQTGTQPVAADGTVLWTESKFTGERTPPEISLYMFRRSSPEITLLARKSAAFSGYQAAGDRVVWAFFPPADDEKVFLYSISGRQSRAISDHPGRYPVMGGGKVAWSELTREGTSNWTVRVYDIKSAGPATPAFSENGSVRTLGLTPGGLLLYAVANSGGQKLLLRPV